MDFPFAKLAEDISADRPAGSDLEIDGDADFMRFTAQIEGVLPQSFAGFDRASVDLPVILSEVGGLLAKSKDLRIVTAAAKLFILNRDLAGFERCVSAIAQWMGERWDQIFPELMDGDPIMRSIALQSLDDIPHTVKPLEAAPLFKSRRAGGVSLRHMLLSEGKMPPRQGGEDGEDEKAPSQGDIASAIREADLAEIVASRDHALRLAAALASIEALWDEKTGLVGELRFKELRPKTKEICAFLENAAVSRDPSLALQAPEAADGESGEDEAGESRPAVSGAVANLDQARAAMEAAERYFGAREPSSPVRLVLAQASALLGKSFYESLQQLIPDYAPQASLSLGRDLPLKLPLERLAMLLPVADFQAGGEETPPEDEPADVEGTGEAGEDQTGTDEAHEDAPGEPDNSENGAAGSRPASAPVAAAGASPGFAAASRAEAMALLDAAAAYFRAAEPSSAIPLLIDIARSAAGRDFLSLLRESLPPQAIRVDE